MATVGVDGADLYFTERGSGLPCIALHGGLGFDHSYLASTLRPLEETIRLIYLDQRGNGRSKDVSLDTITLPRLADDVEALRERLGLDEVAVLGHSYGGFVALEYATRYPDRLSHLFALDTSPGAFEPTDDELAMRPEPSSIGSNAARAKEHWTGVSTATTVDDFTARITDLAPAYVRTAPPEQLARVLLSGVVTPRAMVRGLEVLQGWSVADRLDRIGCPTFVACGRYDLFTTPECSARIASRVPGAELVWFEDGGHFPWIDEPESFFAAVKAWLARHG